MELIKNLRDVQEHYNTQLNLRKAMIKKAIDASYNMLTLNEFMEATEFKMPNIMDLNNIRRFHADVPVLLTRSLIEAFGYGGSFSDQKKCLLKLMKAHNLSYIKLTNEEYERFASDPEHPRNNENSIQEKKSKDTTLSMRDLYPSLVNPNGKSIHILMMPRDLNKLMMVVNTPKGDIMREFCMTIVDLFELYLSYQNEYKSKQLGIKDKKIDDLLVEMKEMRLDIKKMDNTLTEAHEELKEVREDLGINQEILTEMNTKFDIATDDRSVKTKSITKRDKFVILKINKPDYQWQYYAIRVQHVSLKRTLRKLRNKYPDYTDFIMIPYQPNGINFFNLMKEQLSKNKIVYHRNEIKLAVSYSEEQFLQDIKDLDASKKEVHLESSESDD